MSAVAYILLATLLSFLTCLALGAWLMQAIRLRCTSWEGLVYRFLLGATSLSLLVFLLSALGIVHKGVIYAVAALAIASRWKDRPNLNWPPWHWSAIPFTVYITLYLAHAMAPEHSPDGMTYHLGLVARYYREHGFQWFATNMYAYLSQGLEMLFLFAFAIGKHSAAAMIHFLFLLMLPILLAVSAGRTGWLAGLFVFFLPVVGIDGISSYNDVALTVVLFAVWHAMARWKSTNDFGWLHAAAILAGFAFAIKFTGIIAVLFLLPAWRFWPRWSLCLLSVLPWLLKNYLWSGNPFAPFFNQWFSNPWFNFEFESSYRSFLRTYDLSGFSEWAREVFLGGSRLSGSLGPTAIVLPLAFAAWRTQRSLLAAAAITLAIYPLNIGTRFLIPALPFLTLALFQAYPRISVPMPLLAALLSWPSIYSLYSSPHGWFLEKMPWKAALRLESEDGFLTRKSAGYITARAIERFVPAGESVFALSPIPESYTSRNIIVAYQSTIGLKLQHALTAPTYIDYQARFRYQCAGPLIQVAKDTKDTWSILEILPRPQSVNCNRNPWDQSLTTDGNYTTRWRTWGPARQGDHCLLTPAQPYTVLGTGDQWEVELSGCTREVVTPSEDYRAEVRKFFLSQKVRYLAIDAPDYNSQDIKQHTDLWGLDLLAERGTMRIYRWR
jgi:hypothetical protein